MRDSRVWLVGLLLLFAGFIWMASVEVEEEDYTLGLEEGTAPRGIFEDSENLGSLDLAQGAFFVDYRLKRDRTRGQEIEVLKGLLDHPHTTQESRREAEGELVALVGLMEQELMVENMIRAKGFQDAVLFFQDGMANVVVQARELTEEEFMQIMDITASVTKEKLENIMVIANY